ncbi:MAG: LysR family transcriptional regulator [Hydrogenibacillus schlegelii]|nr:LysR family transcriptional regulator [Hydrogenibacillus schlegelii]
MAVEYLNLRRLNIFRTVVRHMNFSRAAEELYLSQPAVSQHIRQLEEYFGVKLFEQAGKQLVLTEAGAYLKDAADRLFRQLEEVQQTIKDIRTNRVGTLTITADTSAGAYVVPPFLGLFHREHPQVALKLEVANRSAVLQRLFRAETDLAVMGYPKQSPYLEAEPFLDNRLVVIAPADHPLAGERNIPLRRLEKEPFLLRERGSGTRSTTERFFQENGVFPNVRMELGSIAAIKEAVAAGIGISVVSEVAIRLERRVGLIAVLDVEGFPIVRQWYVVHPAQQPLSPLALAFRQLLLEQGRAYGAFESAVERFVAEPAAGKAGGKREKRDDGRRGRPAPPEEAPAREERPAGGGPAGDRMADESPSGESL